LGLTANARDRCDVLEKIKVELLVQRLVDHSKGADQEKRVSVGWRSRDRLCGNIAASTRSVLDNKRLTEPLRKPLTREACEDIGHAAGGKADDNPHRPRRIGLCPGDARQNRQRGSARGQMQKLSAGKFHSGSLYQGGLL